MFTTPTTVSCLISSFNSVMPSFTVSSIYTEISKQEKFTTTRYEYKTIFESGTSGMLCMIATAMLNASGMLTNIIDEKS